MANKIDWSIIDDGFRFVFKIPLQKFKKKTKWYEFWKDKYDFNWPIQNKCINRQIKIIKLFKP